MDIPDSRSSTLHKPCDRPWPKWGALVRGSGRECTQCGRFGAAKHVWHTTFAAGGMGEPVEPLATAVSPSTRPGEHCAPARPCAALKHHGPGCHISRRHTAPKFRSVRHAG